MTNTNTEKSRQLLFILLIILSAIITTVTYSNSFHNSFHFDDSHTIVNNVAIRDISKIPTFFKDGTTFSTLPSNQSYRPVVTTLDAIDYKLSGTRFPADPLVFHISIFISYLLLGILIYFFVLHLLDITGPYPFNRAIALFTASWFWLHAANAETINYIIARSDSFSTLMLVLAFVMYIYMPSSRKYYLYMLPIIPGFLAKEPAILFVPLLFFYKLFFEESLSASESITKLSVSLKILGQLIVPIVISALLFLLYKHMTPDTWVSGGTDRLNYILTQPYVILHYFNNFIAPVNLVVDTDWHVVTSPTDDKVIIGCIFLLALLVAGILASRKAAYRPVAFGIVWFFIALAPTSLIPFSEVLNDHRTFFPYIGLFIAAAALLRNLFVSLPNLVGKATGIFFLIMCAFIFLGLHSKATYHRNDIWHTEESLWREATLKAPNNGRAWMNYGLSQMAKANYVAAEDCFKKAIQIWPNYSYIYINMGILKNVTGKPLEAEPNFKKALQLNPNSPECYAYYAQFLIRHQRNSEAVPILQKGLSLSPGHELMNALQKENANTKNPLEGALADVTAKPTAENYLNLSLQYYRAGQYLKCVDASEKALQLKPGYDLAYNNICSAYNELKMWDKAIEAGEKGLKINPKNQQLRNNLNWSYKNKNGK